MGRPRTNPVGFVKPQAPKPASASSETPDQPRVRAMPRVAVEYDPAFCQAIYDHMAAGLKLGSFFAASGVSKARVDKWRKDHPEFAEAYELAHSAHQLFHEEQALGCIATAKPSSGALRLLTNSNPEDYRPEAAHTAVLRHEISGQVKVDHDKTAIDPLLVAQAFSFIMNSNMFPKAVILDAEATPVPALPVQDPFDEGTLE